MKRIGVLGEIGSGNVGDDLGYILIRGELLSRFGDCNKLAEVMAITPSIFHMLWGYHFDGIVVGAGTLLDRCCGPYMEKLSWCQDASLPYAILGTGTCDETLFPPTPEGKVVYEKVIAGATAVVHRSDAETMTLLGAQPVVNQNSRKFGVSIGYAARSQNGLDRIFEWLRAQVSVMRNYDCEPVFVSGWNADDKIVKALQIATGEGGDILKVDGSWGSIKELSTLRNLFAGRAHLAALAACCGVYPYLLPVSSKFEEVMIGMHAPFGRVNIGEPHDFKAVRAEFPNEIDVAKAVLQKATAAFVKKVAGV